MRSFADAKQARSQPHGPHYQFRPRSEVLLTVATQEPAHGDMRGRGVMRLPQRWRIALPATAALVVIVLAACGGELPDPSPSQAVLSFTRGPVPESAQLPDGSIDNSQVPDFIPATDGDRNVGWIWSADVLPAEGEELVEVVTVYADDLTTVVGRMFPDVGFIPLGSEDEMLPDPHRNRELTIRVRNESAQPAILEITEARDESKGPPQLIAPPIVVSAGTDEEVTFRSPRDRWSLNLRGDLGFFFSDDLGGWATDQNFSLVVGDDGVLRIDRGT